MIDLQKDIQYVKGIGPKTAKKIIEKFGNETVHIFKFEPEKLR